MLNLYGVIFADDSLPILVKMIRQTHLHTLRIGRVRDEHCAVLYQTLSDLSLTGVMKIYNENVSVSIEIYCI
jgi:hypothetical protein